jgi:DNA repair protein RecN (Recombination protein N)
MLVRLDIRDIVLIHHISLEFSKGLTVITGETGAGKSVLLQALLLVLGARADYSLIRQGASQGSVTATFDNISEDVQTLYTSKALKKQTN